MQQVIGLLHPIESVQVGRGSCIDRHLLLQHAKTTFFVLRACGSRSCAYCLRCSRRGIRYTYSLISSRMFACPLHTPTQRRRYLAIGHTLPCLFVVCRPHRLLALLHCTIHVYTHRFGFRGGSVLHLSLPIQVRIHPTHVATRATYAYALALFVLTRHSFTRKRTLSFGHTCPVVLFARVGQYVNGRPV